MSIIGALPYTFVNGQVADASQVNADFNTVVANVNANAAHSGINNDITALTGLTTPIPPAGGGSPVFFSGDATTGSANAQVLDTTTPSTYTLTAGYLVSWIAGVSCTAAMTLAVGTTPATTVKKINIFGALVDTGAGDVIAGGAYVTVYDGTQQILLNPSSFATNKTLESDGSGNLTTNFTTLKTVASASTCDIGAGVGSVVAITGTTTITSLGTSASVAAPLYFVTFTGALTLTYNATSLILPNAGDILTADGDSAIFLNSGSGNWQCLGYFPFTETAGLTLATNSQALSGTDNTHAVSSAGLASNKSLATSGYMEFPGGLIIQWGFKAGASTSITWPIAFPNAFFSASHILDTTTVTNTTGIINPTTTGATTASGAIGFWWMAIGN